MLSTRSIDPDALSAVNGLYDEGIWDQATFRNVNDEELFIDTPDFPPESNTGYRWFAMHDTQR